MTEHCIKSEGIITTYNRYSESYTVKSTIKLHGVCCNRITLNSINLCCAILNSTAQLNLILPVILHFWFKSTSFWFHSSHLIHIPVNILQWTISIFAPVLIHLLFILCRLKIHLRHCSLYYNAYFSLWSYFAIFSQSHLILLFPYYNAFLNS